MFFWLPYFSPKSLGFFLIWLLLCFRVISLLSIKFSFVVLDCPVYQYCFTLCRYLFNLPSFARTFQFISSSCIVIFSCVAFSLLFLHVPASFLRFIIFACFRRFLSAFPVEFPILVLIFFFVILRRS